MNERLTPLPSTAWEAMGILRPHFERADRSLPRSQAEQVLTHAFLYLSIWWIVRSTDNRRVKVFHQFVR